MFNFKPFWVTQLPGNVILADPVTRTVYQGPPMQAQ